MSTQLLFKAQEHDCPEIYEALGRLKAKSPAKQMVLADLDAAYISIKQAAREGRLYLYGDFAILVDIGTPWYMTEKVLIEEIIIRVWTGAGNDVAGAIEQLDEIAKSWGCVAIAAGDTQIGLMSDRYKAAGFSPIGSQFFKEL